MKRGRKAKGIFGDLHARDRGLIFFASRGEFRIAVRHLVLIFTILIVLCGVAAAQEKKPYVLYAMLTESTPVQLADGAKWQMDKGDTFPVVMFKEQHTKLILQLAGTSFVVKAGQVQTVEEKDLTEAQLATYRTNVNRYIENQSEKWKEQAK